MQRIVFVLLFSLPILASNVYAQACSGDRDYFNTFLTNCRIDGATRAANNCGSDTCSENPGSCYGHSTGKVYKYGGTQVIAKCIPLTCDGRPIPSSWAASVTSPKPSSCFGGLNPKSQPRLSDGLACSGSIIKPTF